VLRKDALALEDQVRHRGPVPLDRLSGEPLAAYGFGDEVRRALARRADTLRALGVDPSDPDRLAKLREVERQSLGTEFSSRSGQSFVAETPPMFHGRVQISERCVDGTQCAIVSDGARFVVTTASADLRARDGQTVTLQRGTDGRCRARAPDKDRGR
jgi:hypothetical protein